MTPSYDEARRDAAMQDMYEMEKAWGVPFASFEQFMRHSVVGGNQIKNELGLEGGEGPFQWDSEVHAAAAKALVSLRSKQILSDLEFSQLCWMERSLCEEVSFCVGPSFSKKSEWRLLSVYAELINGAQLKLLREWSHALDDEEDDLVEDNFSDHEDVIPFPNPNAEMDTSFLDEHRAKINSRPHKVKENWKRSRLLKYLQHIS